MLGNQPVREKVDRTARAAQSWETPAVAADDRPAGRSDLIGGTLSLAAVAAFLRRNGRKILSLALILFTVGIVILSIIPARYAATALILVDPREQRVTTEQDVLPGIGQDAAALQSMVEIAKSDGFLRPLVEKLKIASDSDIADGETNDSKLLDKFRKRLDVSRRGLTYVIAVTFLSDNPQQASRYANAVAEAFVANQSQTRVGATEEAAGWLSSRLKALSDQLRVSEDAVAAFKAKHGIINAGKESTTGQLRVTELNQQVSAARLRAEEAKNRYEQAQRDFKANIDGPSATRSDLLTTLRAQRTQLNDQIAQKRAVFGDRHPDLVISYNQLSELNRQIDIERRRSIDSARSDYQTLQDQQKALEQQLKTLESEMLLDVQSAVKLQELQRDADANRNIYEQFLSRFKTTNEQRSLQMSQTQIVSAATPPTRSTRPPLSLIIVALAIGAVLSATAIVALLDVAFPQGEVKVVEPPVAEPAQAKVVALPELPVWSRIPDLAVPRLDETGWHAAAAPREGGADLRSHLHGLLAAIRALPKPHGKVVLVTSGDSGAGKSSVARSLNALAIERGLLSVLIQIVPEPGAAPGRAAESDQVATYQSHVVQTTARSLDVLLGSAGTVTPGDVRADFDLIVIDAPALGQQKDVAAMAAYADACVLVAGSGVEPAALRKAQAALSAHSALVGLVINKARPVMTDVGGRDRSKVAV